MSFLYAILEFIDCANHYRDKAPFYEYGLVKPASPYMLAVDAFEFKARSGFSVPGFG
jgi:hypothetical protein